MGKIVTLNGGKLKLVDGVLTEFPDGAKDAFGRLRVSEPYIRFEAAFRIDGKDFLFSDSEENGGTVTRDATAATIDITATTANNSRALRQTREFFKYVAGISPEIQISGKFDTGKANVKQRVGLFSDDNGIFFEEENGTVSVIIRSNVTGSIVEDKVSQASWNRDVMDGTGDSGVTIDWEKVQIFFIDFQWLSIGRVRLGLVVDGALYYVHEFNHANILTEKYMRTAVLPIRAEVVNDGTSASSTTFKLFCCSYIEEGRLNGPVRLGVASRGSSSYTIVNSEFRPVVSVRLQSGIDATIIPQAISFLCTSADPIYIELRLNATLSNGTNWTDITNSSIAQQDIGSNDVAGGEVIWADYLWQRVNSNIDLKDVSQKLGCTYGGGRDTLSLVAISLNNNATVPNGLSTCYGAIKFAEDY